MKKVNSNELVNWWLEKYHGTNLDKVNKENPKWAENPGEHSREFYDKYRVTEEQHDEWEDWAKEYTRTITKLSKKALDKSWWSVYLNTSPSLIIDKDEIRIKSK